MADKPLKPYRVAIVETLRMVVTVEAEDAYEAEQLVSDRWHNSDYILDAESFDGVEFKVLGEADAPVDGKDSADR